MPTVKELASIGIQHSSTIEAPTHDVRIAAEARAKRFRAAMDKGDPNAARENPNTEDAAALKALAEKEKAEKTKADEAKPVKGTVVDTLLAPPEENKEADPLAEFSEKDPKNINVVKMRTTLETVYKERVAALTEIDRLKSELASKAAAPTSDELAALRRERDELAAAIKLERPENDPEFKAKHIDGRSRLVDKIANKVDAGGGKADDIRDALKMTGKAKDRAIKEALSELDADDKADVRAFIVKLEDQDEERDAYLADADTKRTERRAKQETQTRAQREQETAQLATEFDELTRTLPANFFPLKEAAPNAEGAEAWNVSVREGKELARKALNGELSSRQRTELFLKGARADALLRWGMDQYERANKAEKAAAGLTKSLPEINGRGGPTSREMETAPKANPTRQDLVAEFQARWDRAQKGESAAVD